MSLLPSMPRGSVHGGATLGDFLAARPTGLTEVEAWAILCQAVQALQDLFLCDGASGGFCIPLVTPSTLLLSGKGRVKLLQSPLSAGCGPPTHLLSYLAPEYRPNKHYTDTEIEKMWIYGLGETMKRATLTSHAATSRLSGDLCQVFTNMTRPQATVRASLMHLLDVISDYCKRRQQTKPFSHIVMDLHQEAMAELESVLESPWGLTAMPEIRRRTVTRCDPNPSTTTSYLPNTFSLPRRWTAGLSLAKPPERPRLTREASTSMEDLTNPFHLPGTLVRPKSMCLPLDSSSRFPLSEYPTSHAFSRDTRPDATNLMLAPPRSRIQLGRPAAAAAGIESLRSAGKTRPMRNPVQRAASRLYRAGHLQIPENTTTSNRECVGPEFVVRATLPSKQYVMPDCKGSVRKAVTVVMLNGQKLAITCNPNTTTTGQLFELIIKKEQIEENFMFGLSALVGGDFVFLPSDARLCKAVTHAQSLTLFVRVRFFLPSLRGVRSLETRHFLYLQLRRSILEFQLPSNYSQLVELGGLALQVEFGDFCKREHGARDYFLLEHYVPETFTGNRGDGKQLRQELTRAHMSRKGLEIERAEEDFIVLAQSLPNYGGHFYTAIWVLKDNTQKNVWLYVSAQGINLYERDNSNAYGLVVLEMFEWRTIQTLCYSKHYLCILPHRGRTRGLKLKKYKLKMDYKKSYFTFRLASLHHQFFLRLRTQYSSLQTLSEQFGVQLKDMKNETNSLCKLESLANPLYNAETEFRIEFAPSNTSSLTRANAASSCRRSKSVTDLNNAANEEYQNKENENPQHRAYVKRSAGLVLDSSYLSGLPATNLWDKRRGVKMGVSAFTGLGRVSRSMETMNGIEEMEKLSLLSIPSVEQTQSLGPYVVDVKADETFLPNFHETINQTLLDKLEKFSYTEERLLHTVHLQRDTRGSLGIQITEGSDGKVYIQSVIPHGAADTCGGIHPGDQIIAVDGRSLLNLPYKDALELLTRSGHSVDLVLSQSCDIHSRPTLPLSEVKRSKSRVQMDLSNINESHLNDFSLESTVMKLKRMSYPNTNRNYLFYLRAHSPVEKHTTENCCETSSKQQQQQQPLDVPYHKHIRYNCGETTTLNRSLSKSCTHIGETPRRENNRAVIIDMIPKSTLALNWRDDDEPREEMRSSVARIALPRSLGLSRKWKGPVRYPVTPIKKYTATDCCNSDEEQVFI